MPHTFHGNTLSRRQLLALSFATPAILGGRAAEAGVHVEADFWSQPRYVWLKSQKTGEEIKETYWSNGQLNLKNYEKICWFLRDWRRDQAVYYSTVVLDVMYATAGWLAYFKMPRPVMFTSGYRHPLTNAAIEGSVKDSLHTKGRALDGFVSGVPTESLAKFGLWLKGGGIGFYPSRNFTHFDDGNLRVWRG